MKRFLLFAMVIAAMFASLNCSDDDGSGAGDSDSDSDGDSDGDSDSDSDGDVGTLTVTGNWVGNAPNGSNLRVSVFECPFAMPPEYFFEGTWDSDSGDVYASLDDVEAGDWCLMAYIDIDSSDGLAPVDGLDAVNDIGSENSDGALEITVFGGETTTVDLVFAI